MFVSQLPLPKRSSAATEGAFQSISTCDTIVGHRLYRHTLTFSQVVVLAELLTRAEFAVMGHGLAAFSAEALVDEFALQFVPAFMARE